MEIWQLSGEIEFPVHVYISIVRLLNERKKGEELGELLGLEPVSLMTKKSRLRWFGQV